MAGSSHALTSQDAHGIIREVLTSFVGDDTDGTVPTLVVSFGVDVELLELETNPGSTGPTANYDITAVDAAGADRIQGVGANRHTSATEVVPILYASTSQHPILKAGTALTVTIANTSVNDATGTILIRYRSLTGR
jgi:hypothetical protein